MNRNNGIDLFRLLGAFFIMILHSGYGKLNPEYVENLRLLARWAVPFYYITTGFFIGPKINSSNLDFKNIQNNISTLITILIVASIIYIPINILMGETSYGVGNLLTGTFFHLWFIGSLLFGYIFIWYLFYIKKHNLLPYISSILLLLAIFTDSYDQFFGLDLSYGLFRFLLSVPFLSLGIFISRKKIFIKNKKALFGLATIGIIIQLTEVNLINFLFDYSKYLPQFLIGTIITTICIFMLSSIINIKESKITKWGRQHSLFIYLYHPIALMFIKVITLKIFPIYGNSIEMFSLIIGFTLILLSAILLDKYFPKGYKILNGRLLIKKGINNI